MSSDDNHRQAHMTPTARKICGVFAKSSFNCWPSDLFFFTCCVAIEEHYMLCCIEEFF